MPEREQPLNQQIPLDGGIARVDRDPTPIDRLRALAQAFRTQEFIIGGVDEAAQANNLLVVEALRATGDKLKGRANDVFGIHIGGSRIKGYNTVDSDIDLVVVTPDDAPASEFVYDALHQELQKRGVNNGIDSMMGMWANYDVKTDPDEFIYTVDHQGQELIALFGNTLVYNPNLLLARLTALEVINQYTYYDYNWSVSSQNYAATYLGERPHLVPKLAERYEIPRDDVGKIFTPALFHKRYEKFGLIDPKTMLGELREWRKANGRQLGNYKMNRVYKEVMEQLRSS